MSQVETAFEEMVLDQVVEQKNLIVFNDHVNSFDHVIDSLVKVCKHDMIQAEQCTWLVHYTGKCQVNRLAGCWGRGRCRNLTGWGRRCRATGTDRRGRWRTP